MCPHHVVSVTQEAGCVPLVVCEFPGTDKCDKACEFRGIDFGR